MIHFSQRNERSRGANREQEGFGGDCQFNSEGVSKTRGPFVWRRGLPTTRSCENVLLLARMVSVSRYTSLPLTAAASGALIVHTLLA